MAAVGLTRWNAKDMLTLLATADTVGRDPRMLHPRSAPYVASLPKPIFATI